MADTKDILSSTLLSVNNNPAFADAEPYHYGTGTPLAGNFNPIGEDNDAKTEDFKIQAPENNGYSTIKKIPGFKINNKDIQYIEVGTFPVLNLLKSYTSACLVCVTVVYNGRDVVRMTLDAYSPDNASELVDPFTIYDSETGVANFKAHGNEVCPKRLGFILTGAGGGAGGFSWYDANKNGSSDDRYITPGGGGGGGEIIYGVIDVSYPDWFDLPAKAFIDYTEFLFHIGKGGAAGATQTSDGVTATKPKPGTNGGAGEKSWMRIHVHYGYLDDRVGAISSGVQIDVAGGGGGSAGGEKAAGAGGDGGSTSSSDKNYYLKCFQKSVDGICVRGHHVGGNGGPSSTENGQNEELSYSIYFGNTLPDITSSSFYTYKDEKTHDALSGSSSSASSIDNIIIPGGHSLGTGGSKSVAPTKGGGGACCKTDKDHSRGADGFVGIYY